MLCPQARACVSAGWALNRCFAQTFVTAAALVQGGVHVRSAATVICVIIVALQSSEPRDCLEYCMVSRVRQLILVLTKKKRMLMNAFIFGTCR